MIMARFVGKCVYLWTAHLDDLFSRIICFENKLSINGSTNSGGVVSISRPPVSRRGGEKNHLALSVSSPTTGCRQVCWTLCIVKLNGNPYRDLRNHRLPPAHLFQHIASFAWRRKNMWHCYVTRGTAPHCTVVQPPAAARFGGL